MHDTSGRHVSAGERLAALKALAASTGWKLFLERHEKKVAELQETALAPATPDETTRMLKHALALHRKDNAPDKLLGTLITATENDAKRETQEFNARANIA